MSVKFLELFPGTVSFQGTSMESTESEELSNTPSYSLTFWLFLSKSEKNKQVTVIHKGTNTHSSPLIAIQERTLYIKLDIDRNRSECLFSSFELPLRKWVFITFTLKESEILEGSLYLNGVLDSEVSVTKIRESDRLTGTNKVYIGKDPWSHGLVGSVSEPCFYLQALDSETVEKLHALGRENWKKQKAFSTAQLFYTVKNERSQSALPTTARLPKVLETSSNVKRSLQTVGTSAQERLDYYFDHNQSIYLKVTQLLSYGEWLTVFYRILRLSLPLFRDEEGNFENKIEINRMMPALAQFRLLITKKEIIEISKMMKVHQVVQKETGQEDVIFFVEFFEKLRIYVDALEMGDFDLISRDEMELTEKRNNLITKADEWYSARTGNFEICIDFCANCKSHQTSTWHDANEFIQWYNDVYKDINDEFPGISVNGNKFGAPSIGVFSVYLEYLSPTDKNSRLKVYKTKNSKPNSREIVDSLHLLCYIYEDSNELGNTQNEFKRKFGETDRHPQSFQGPGTVSTEPVQGPRVRKAQELEPDTEMLCKNWGCPKRTFLFGKNHKKACSYHPGRWEFGSVHALWPENWTCCRAAWDSPGCKTGFHRGVVNQKVQKRCINRGELNPKTQKLDSICGALFLDPATCGKKYSAPNDCRYHTGHREVVNSSSCVWTCCRMESNPSFQDESFCAETQHRFEEWPNEEAKIYFVTRMKKNEGFSEAAKQSRFFNRDIKPYVDPSESKKEKMALDGENRYCLNWACEKVYKENENFEKACRCHTGYWDFGHSGILKGRETIILWEPHWRCCGGKWEDPGCSLSSHSGPILSKMEDRKWKWPSEGAKRNFLKKISNLWQKKLESENLSRREVSLKYDQFCNEIASKILPAGMLHRFTLNLHLHILCVSEDLSFMFKYQDVISKQAENLLSDRTGHIDKDTFLEWWFAPLERIRPEMAAS